MRKTRHAKQAEENAHKLAMQVLEEPESTLPSYARMRPPFSAEEAEKREQCFIAHQGK
jgi:hypothetical protein